MWLIGLATASRTAGFRTLFSANLSSFYLDLNSSCLQHLQTIKCWDLDTLVEKRGLVRLHDVTHFLEENPVFSLYLSISN